MCLILTLELILDERVRHVPGIRHFELPISDTRDQTELGYRRGPEDLKAQMRQLQHDILFLWGVPPQVRSGWECGPTMF